MSETDIKDRLVAREERALAELYDELASRVYGLALSMVGETGDAEEIVSDTFVQVWRTADSFDPERGHIDAWVIAICRSRALDRLRIRKRRGKLADREEQRIARFTTSEGAPDPAERAIVRAQMSGTVAPALRELPAEQRRAIELAYLGGLSQREVSRTLDVPLGTVKTRIRSGMQKLRDALSSHDSTRAREGGA